VKTSRTLPPPLAGEGWGGGGSRREATPPSQPSPAGGGRGEQPSLRLRLAQALLRHRRASLLAFALLSLFFAAGLPRVKLETIFSDLLPADSPFVQVYRDHPNFGSPLTVLVMVRRTDGDIYNAETISKVWQLTRDIDLAPAVDHDQIVSITTTKARYSEATPTGIDMRPLMADTPPQTGAEIASFRARVEKAPNVRSFLISQDQRSAIILATFIEQRLDYGETFDYLQGLVESARDAQHEVYLAGQPVLIGWVYRHEWQMVGIAAVTVGLLLLALALYMRNWVGVLTPLITSATAAIWAFGFVGWLGVSIEPLLMVVPLLLTARSFSHSVQFTERYYEIYAELRHGAFAEGEMGAGAARSAASTVRSPVKGAITAAEVGDRRKAAELTMAVMLTPSVLGILTDILGIVVVVAAPIPAMVRHAIFCGMWAVWLIPTGVVLISLLLASLPPPRNVQRLVGQGRAGGVHRLLVLGLAALASLLRGRRRLLATVVVVLLSALTIHTARQIRIGNPVEGSNLLWPDSEFNRAVHAINGNFPGVNTLEIVLEAKNPDDPNWTAQQLDTVMTMTALQRAMEASAAPPRASLSFADYLQEASRLFNGGDPKWLPLDPRQRAVSAAATGAMMGSSAKNFGHVISDDAQHATVSLWYADNRQETVDAALAAAERAVAQVGIEHEHFRVRLGSGLIALQEAVNRVIGQYQWTVLGAVNVMVFALCAIAYRSLLAGLILLVPVNLANEAMIAAMHLLGVGLDVNSMIVAAIGVGVGIDYGIYLLSRVCEEYRLHAGDWEAALAAALATTGKAILFTASIMSLGIAPWYALSDLKFVADMGLLLMVIMIVNMGLALVVLPLLLAWIRPAFVARGAPLLGEGLSPELLAESGRAAGGRIAG
jgi:predicted RND superfamily exporter protein